MCHFNSGKCKNFVTPMATRERRPLCCYFVFYFFFSCLLLPFIRNRSSLKHTCAMAAAAAAIASPRSRLAARLRDTQTSIDGVIRNSFNREAENISASSSSSLSSSSSSSSSTLAQLSSLRGDIVTSYTQLGGVYDKESEQSGLASLAYDAASFVHRRRARLSKRLSYLQSLLPHHRSNPRLLSDLARVYHELGDLGTSEIYYKRSIAIDGLAANNLANLLTETKKWKEAADAFRSGLERKLRNIKCGDTRTTATTTTTARTVTPHYSWHDENIQQDEDITVQVPAPASYIITLRDINLVGASGAMMAAKTAKTCSLYLGGQGFMHRFRYEKATSPLISGETSLGALKTLEAASLVAKGTFIDVNANDAIVLNVVQGWANNFYHATVEIGGRLALLKQYVINPSRDKATRSDYSGKTFLLLHPAGDMVNNIMDLLGMRGGEGLHFAPYEYRPGHRVHAKTLVFADFDFDRERDRASPSIPEVPAERFVPSKHALLLLQRLVLRENLKRKENNARTLGQIMIFASRNGAKRGGIIGEKYLYEALVSTFQPGFDVTKFIGKGLPLRDQMEIFQRASVIIGLHGAALSNLIFSQPGTIVLEIPLRPFDEGPYFKLMAEALGLCYGHTATRVAVRYVSSLVLDEFKIAHIVTVLRGTMARCMRDHPDVITQHESL